MILIKMTDIKEKVLSFLNKNDVNFEESDDTNSEIDIKEDVNDTNPEIDTTENDNINLKLTIENKFEKQHFKKYIESFLKHLDNELNELNYLYKKRKSYNVKQQDFTDNRERISILIETLTELQNYDTIASNYMFGGQLP
jgi:predicted RNase H-like nuclease (RuvC/YqgF family)